MKGKQLAILLALVVVIGGAGYFLYKKNQSDWSSSGGGAGGKVLDFPINDVAQVRLATAGADVNLVKKNDIWTVQERADYPANFEQVSGLLRKLWELKTVQEVKVGPSQMPRLELVEPGKGDRSGTLIEFKDKDGKSLSGLLLGKNYVRKSEAPMMELGASSAGRYVMPTGSGKVSLVSETFTDVDPKPERWLQKDFLKIDQPKAISIAGQTDSTKWSLTRDSATADWKLAEAKAEEQLDNTKVSSFASLFSGPTFRDVLAPDAKLEETGLDKPTEVTIETFDNIIYTLKIGKLANEGYPALVSVTANLAKERTPGKDEKPEDKARLDEEFKNKQKSLEEKLASEKKFEGRPFVLEKYTVEPLLKERSALLAEKKPDPANTSTTPTPGIATPPVPVPPVSVTTPPVSVPIVPATPPAPELAKPEMVVAPVPPAPPAASTSSAAVPPSAPSVPTSPVSEKTDAPPAAPAQPSPASTPAAPAPPATQPPAAPVTPPQPSAPAQAPVEPVVPAPQPPPAPVVPPQPSAPAQAPNEPVAPAPAAPPQTEPAPAPAQPAPGTSQINPLPTPPVPPAQPETPQTPAPAASEAAPAPAPATPPAASPSPSTPTEATPPENKPAQPETPAAAPASSGE